ncbi:MAG: hypothetical protein AAFP67_03575, partial [Pseudomonadota bacterium]
MTSPSARIEGGSVSIGDDNRPAWGEDRTLSTAIRFLRSLDMPQPLRLVALFVFLLPLIAPASAAQADIL